VLIAAHNAIKSAAGSQAKERIPEVDKKFKVAIDLLYHFVEDFPTLNPNIRDAGFMHLIDNERFSQWTSRSPFSNLGALNRSIISYVEFSSDSSSLNADES
jgi:hypothetical protein